MRILLTIFFGFSILFAQNIDSIRPSVVLIESLGHGTGLVTGYDDKRLYIVTAEHVVELPEDISVSFWEGDGRREARLDSNFAGSLALDLAVISVERREGDEQYLKPFGLGEREYMRDLDEVVFVGHPGDRRWYPNKQNKVQMPDAGGNSQRFEISNAAITRGHSGSPVWNDCGQWIGLLLQEKDIAASCLSSSEIARRVPDAWLNLLSTAKSYPCINNQVAKDSLMDILNRDIDTYISRSRDLADNLKTNRNRLFYGLEAVAQLSMKLEKYNEYYERLNAERYTWIGAVKRHWRTEELDDNMRSLMKQILDDFHKTEVLPYNVLLERINTYNQAPLFKREKKKTIQKDLDLLVDQIENRLNSIEAAKNILLTELEVKP
ncbi:MAG: serine protease [Bacteroidia bacterium]